MEGKQFSATLSNSLPAWESNIPAEESNFIKEVSMFSKRWQGWVTFAVIAVLIITGWIAVTVVASDLVATKEAAQAAAQAAEKTLAVLKQDLGTTKDQRDEALERVAVLEKELAARGGGAIAPIPTLAPIPLPTPIPAPVLPPVPLPPPAPIGWIIGIIVAIVVIGGVIYFMRRRLYYLSFRDH
ncbi:MAG: hypothetical protein V1705_01835 [bacterium]